MNTITQITRSNRIEFVKKGKLHREDGPAVIWNTGREDWYYNGRLHREDGPAISYPDRPDEQWYQNGVMHREDGPARTWHDGSTTWYINGVPQTAPVAKVVEDVNTYLQLTGLDKVINEAVSSGDTETIKSIRDKIKEKFPDF